jgi:putative photosynthetic complex assembly protein 2
MQTYVYPTLFSLGVWWASTVLIIYLDGLPRPTFKWSFLGASILFVLALWGLTSVAHDTSLKGAYLGFTYGVLAWGWQEVSFYMGFVTGPRNEPCPEGCKGWAHFGHAIQTSLYHELAIVAVAILITALTWNAENTIGRWTFLIMWWMHQSAKLNVFFGVRNLGEEFLPEHLAYLKSFFTKKAMNAFFPISVSVSLLITAWLVERSQHHSAGLPEQVGYIFLTALMALAILEHWLLVIPMPSTALFGMGLKSRKGVVPADIEVIAGFLGSGKSTFLRRVLAAANPEERTIVLLNDFADAGVDASLMRGRGADVVELPNGCVCCSLRGDLAKQLRDVVVKFSPKRVLIEPSGVAEVGTLLSALRRPEIADIVKSIKVYTLIDASAFLKDFVRMPEYFEAQANVAPVLIVNKRDLVSPAMLQTVEDTLRPLNPAAHIVYASFGMVDSDGLKAVDATVKSGVPAHDPVDSGTDHDHAHEHDESLGMETWSHFLDGEVDETRLRTLAEEIRDGAFGQVARAKGVMRVSAGWVKFDVAGGRVYVAAHLAVENERARAMAIGFEVRHEDLTQAFSALVGGQAAWRNSPALGVPMPLAAATDG